MDRLLIGNLELCHLPALGIRDLEVRVDTGAKTSSLHVENIQRFKQQGHLYVSFDLHPDIYNLSHTVVCKAPVVDTRRIKSSNGTAEYRYVIETLFELGGLSWPIQLTLTNREEMNYMMLLGREGMGDRVYVDPSQTFLLAEQEK